VLPRFGSRDRPASAQLSFHCAPTFCWGTFLLRGVFIRGYWEILVEKFIGFSLAAPQISANQGI
jgi:hypothetical protein